MIPSTFSRPTDSSDTATVISQGSIQFASPDKGLFHVETCWRVAVEHIPAAEKRVVTVPVIKDGRPQYTEQKQIVGEHWICDGKSVFEFDSLNKQLIKRELPVEMQGKQIVAGPLPFLFGAKAYELNDRYWLHLIPPLEPGEFWLEAIPKRQADAADFQSLIVIIDEKEFLPAGLILVKRGVGPQNGKDKDRYKFENREHNWNITLETLNIFARQFYEPKVPAGWKLVKEKFGADPAPAAANAAPLGPAPARQTQRPPAGPQRPPAVPLRR